MFQAMMGELDAATTAFEAWARKEFTHFLGEDVGNTLAEVFTDQLDLDTGLLESVLSTVDSLQQLASNPRQWEALANMANPATQITEFTKDPKAYLEGKVETLKQLAHLDEMTGEHPMRGVGHLAGDLAQIVIPGAGEAKAASAAERLAAETGQAGKAEGAFGRAGETLGAATRTDITTQGTKLTNDFTKAGELKAPVKAPDALTVKEPGLRPADPGGKAPTGAAGPVGAERAPVEAGARTPSAPQVEHPVPGGNETPTTPGSAHDSGAVQYAPEGANTAADLNSAFTNGYPTSDLAQKVADYSTHYVTNPIDPVSADRVVLGKWDGQDGGYIGEARHNGGIYFDTGAETWDAIKNGLTSEQERGLAWQVNEKFLLTQMEKGVARIEYLLPEEFDSVEQLAAVDRKSYSTMEINLLKERAASFGYRQDGNVWIRERSR
jgi:hypothetical protein